MRTLNPVRNDSLGVAYSAQALAPLAHLAAFRCSDLRMPWSRVARDLGWKDAVADTPAVRPPAPLCAPIVRPAVWHAAVHGDDRDTT